MPPRLACMQLMWGDVAGERLVPWLDEVAALGFAGVGVGFATLRPHLADPAPFAALLAERRLGLASIYVPMATPEDELAAACRLARACGGEHVVLFAWPRGGAGEYDALIAALDRRAGIVAGHGLVAGFHHHTSTPIETYAETAEHLRRIAPERLRLFCDTGHATCDFVEFPYPRRAVELLARHWDRIGLIELKDWSPATGFATDLGAGVAGLAEACALIRARAYAGWIVLEQNQPSADSTPGECARRGLARARALLAADPATASAGATA